MAISLNHTVELTCNGSYYGGIGSVVGKFLLGDRGLEFYADDNPEKNVQLLWESIFEIGANVTGKHQHISRHFEIKTTDGKLLFASPDSGKILKVARTHIGNSKVVRYPTLVQTMTNKIKGLFSRAK